MSDSVSAVDATAERAQVTGGETSGAAAKGLDFGVAKILAMLGVATFIFVMREPSVFTTPSFWGEDGPIFFKGAIEQGIGAFLQQERGQLLIFERIVSFLSAPLPVSMQPALYAVACVAVAVLSCGIVLSSRWRFPIPLNARFLCMLALLCSPAVDEIYVTLTNAHWWLGIGLLLLGMLYDPSSRRLKFGEIMFTAVSAVSGYAAIYGIPSLAVRAWRNRSRYSLLLLGIAVSGLLVQVYNLLAQHVHTGGAPSFYAHPVTEVIALIRRILGGAAMGDTNLAVLWPMRLPALWVWLIPIALVVVLTAVWILASRLETSALLLTLLGGSFVFIWSLDWSIDVLWLFAINGRYVVVPVAILYVSLIVWRSDSARRRVVTGLACVLLAVGILSDYRLSPLSTVPPADWTPFAACVERGTTSCSVVIPPGWTLEIGPRRH